MKNYDRILDGLTKAASREAPPPADDLSPGLATRVLANVRERRRGAREPDFVGVLERWLLGAMPVALVLAGGLWFTSVRPPAHHAAPDAASAVVDALFEEALRP